MKLTKKYTKIYDSWLLFMFGLCFIATLFLALSGYNLTLMIASYIYVLLLLRLKNIKRSILRADFLTVFVAFYSTIRYYIYPFFFCIEASEVFYQKPFALESTFLFIVEEITILIAVNAGLKSLIKNTSLQLTPSNSKVWIIVLMAFVSIFVMNYYPTVGMNYQFIWNLNIASVEGADFGTLIESLCYVLIDATRLLLPLVIINNCLRRYRINKEDKFIFFSFLACMIPMLLIKNMNRGSSFFTSLIYLWIVVQLYGWKKSGKFTIETIGGIGFLLAVVSLVKHASGIENEGYTSGYFYTMLQSYTLGIESIRIGLETNYAYSNINPFFVLYNDIVGSFPILNKYTIMTMRYTTLYNEMYYAGTTNKNDCIAPLITNLIYCFGYIAVLLPAVFYRIAVGLYKKVFTAKSINTVFLLVYTSIVLSSSTGSLSATVATLVWIVMPLAVIVKLMDKINKK